MSSCQLCLREIYIPWQQADKPFKDSATIACCPTVRDWRAPTAVKASGPPKRRSATGQVCFNLKLETYIRTCDCFRVVCAPQDESYEIYSEAKRQFCVINRDVLINAQSPHKWWFTSLPALVSGGWGTGMWVSWRLICCQIILKASCVRNLLICRSLVIYLLVLSYLPKGIVRE